MNWRILSCVVLLAGATVFAQSNLDATLKAIDEKAAKVTDLTTHFEQEKSTALLKEPLVSTGQVRAAGAVVRWDTQTPEPGVLYADQTELRLYYPRQSLEEIYPIDQKLSDLVASPLPRLATIRAHFDIAPDPSTRPTDPDLVALKLSPRDESLKAHVQEVDVLLDSKTGLATHIQTIDPDGDTTTIDFSDVHLNMGLSEKDLALTVPPGTEISHPLAGAETQP